jgi:integrase
LRDKSSTKVLGAMRGSIDYRPDRAASWRARYRSPDGRLLSKAFNRKVDAERWLRTELAKLDRGQWVDPDQGNIAWSDYSLQVIADRPHLSPRTIETDVLCHKRVAAWIGSVPLARLTHEQLRRLMAELTAAGYAPETVARTMRWVKLTLNQAVRDRRIVFSPGDGLLLPKARRADMRILDASEVDQLASALPDRYGSLATVAAYTGMRWGELAGLQTQNIDRPRERLNVRTSLIEASGQPPFLGSPKTDASERTITLPKIVIDFLDRHLDTYPPPDSTVWTTEAGGFLRRGTFGRIWRTAVGESVGTPCRIHDLRHTHAAWLIAEGEHPKTIQTRLGHSSIQVTMDRYGHLMDGLDEQTAIRLDAIAATARNRSANRETPGISL